MLFVLLEFSQVCTSRKRTHLANLSISLLSTLQFFHKQPILPGQVFVGPAQRNVLLVLVRGVAVGVWPEGTFRGRQVANVAVALGATGVVGSRAVRLPRVSDAIEAQVRQRVVVPVAASAHHLNFVVVVRSGTTTTTTSTALLLPLPLALLAPPETGRLRSSFLSASGAQVPPNPRASDLRATRACLSFTASKGSATGGCRVRFSFAQHAMYARYSNRPCKAFLPSKEEHKMHTYHEETKIRNYLKEDQELHSTSAVQANKQTSPRANLQIVSMLNTPSPNPCAPTVARRSPCVKAPRDSSLLLTAAANRRSPPTLEIKKRYSGPQT